MSVIHTIVIPAKAGIQSDPILCQLDSRVRGNDGLIAVLALSLTILASAPVAAEREPVERLSDAHQSNDEAWNETGFRARLDVGYEWLEGDPGPYGEALSLALTPAIRLSQDWSLGLALRYAILLGGRYGGIRWSTTAEPVLHPIDGLELAVGLGFGGLTVSLPEVTEFVEPFACAGSGVIGAARISYRFATGQWFSMGPTLQADMQWAPCDDTRNTGIDSATGVAKLERRWWLHRSISLRWSFAWR